MSTVVATKSTATGSAGDVTITKPTSLAVGDIMIAFINSSTAGATGEEHTGPTGWTKLQGASASNGSILTVWGVVATSTQTAASDFSWTSADTNDTTVGSIFRITGTNGFTSLAANVLSVDDTDLTTAGLTTLADNSLLLLCGTRETTGGADSNFSGYTVANNDPTWTEEYDVGNGAGLRANMGIASATYATAGATGVSTVTADQSGDTSSALVAITENVDVSVTGTTGVLNVQGIEGSVVGSASVTGTTGVLNMVGNEGAATLTDSKWRNKHKTNNSPTIVNKDKS